MSAFTMPTLLVHGEGDVFAPLTTTAACAQRMIFDGRLITYPGASHGLMFTHRKRLNRDLGEFLKSALERRGRQRNRLGEQKRREVFWRHFKTKGSARYCTL
jgi:hypothetical protein